MQNGLLKWVSAVALLAAGVGCGSSGGGGGGGGTGGSGTGGTAGSTGPQSIIDLRADTNRDGKVDPDDPTEDAGEEQWGPTQGAIFFPNIDDDEEKCPRGPAVFGDKNGYSDFTLMSCFDGNNEFIDGAEDVKDMAYVMVVPWPEAPDDASGTITIMDPAPQYVRVFRNGPSGWQVANFPLLLTAPELRAGTELYVEGKDVIRDPAAWGGYVNMIFNVQAGTSPDGEAYPSGEDLLQLRQAPLLLMHHLQKAEQIYVTASGGAGSAAFRQDLGAAATASGVAEGMSEHQVGDQWTQDWMELAYLTKPAEGGQQHRIVAYMRSVNIQGAAKNTDNPFRTAGREVYAAFHGQDVAGFTPSYDLNSGHGSMDSLNSYGNTETLPPYEHNGESYPMGRVYRGSIPDFFPDPAMQKMLDAQQYQPTLNVDTSWLLVGHVDETISFVKMSNARGWGIVINDVALAKSMLEGFSNQGHGTTTMFEGKFWNGASDPAEVSIDGVLADPEVMAESAASAVEVDAQYDILKQEVGLTDADLIPVPFLHEPVSGFSVAYQPGTVNGIYLSDTDFGVPTPHGPTIDGKDPFEEQLTQEFGKHGITVHFIEDWDLYHRLLGEVHCGSNTKRALPENASWWQTDTSAFGGAQ
jgi:protein-arginine deiminase